MGRPIGEDNGPALRGKELARRIEHLRSLGIIQGTARRVLEALGGDEYWLQIYAELESAGSYDKLATLQMFLLQMRDGRPAQQINVTTIGVQFNAEEIQRARGVIRELVKNSFEQPSNDRVQPTPLGSNAAGEHDEAKVSSPRLALGDGRIDGEHALGGARGQKDGDVGVR